MKRVINIKDKNGNVIKQGEVLLRNDMHFQIQLNNRVKVVENKKAYKRSRDKKIGLSY